MLFTFAESCGNWDPEVGGTLKVTRVVRLVLGPGSLPSSSGTWWPSPGLVSHPQDGSVCVSCEPREGPGCAPSPTHGQAITLRDLDTGSRGGCALGGWGLDSVLSLRRCSELLQEMLV